MAWDLLDNLSSYFFGVVNDKPEWASNPSAFWRCFHPVEKQEASLESHEKDAKTKLADVINANCVSNFFSKRFSLRLD